MGTWNATCGITQLPIEDGDRIAFIPLIIKPFDFLARDTLAGCGAVANDIIAQPFSLPLFGVYDGVGGIALDENQVGERCLLAVFEGLVKSERLMRIPNAKPIPVKTASIELLETLQRRELVYHAKNPRKAWLKQLHETYNGLSPAEQKGMSHYKAQMEVNPDTLPDYLELGVGAMMVHEELYHKLVAQAGQADAYGYYDHDENELIEFKGNRGEELANFATLSAENRKKIDELRPQLEEVYKEAAEKAPERIAMFSRLLSEFVLAAMKPAIEISENVMFFPQGVKLALAEAGNDDNADARKLWADFILFNSVMNYMRKHWTPQTGAGSSAGLRESFDLYAVQNEFTSKALDMIRQERAEVAEREAKAAEKAAEKAAAKAAKASGAKRASKK